jgi:inner membrane protein
VEPITHFLTGACLARLGFNRKTALATLTMTLAAEASDIDIVSYVNGSVSGFVCHRGATHTVWGIPLVSAVVLALVFAGRCLRQWWRRRRGRTAHALTPRWGLLYLFACVAGYSHLLLDFTNNYGLRPLWPWWPKWYAWDIVFIIEPLLLMFLIGGLVLPSLFALVNREIGARETRPRGRVGAAVALILMVLLWGVRDYEHRRAVNAMDALNYLGKIPVGLSAFPYMVNPFRWYGVVDTGNSYIAMEVDSLAPAVDPQGRARVYSKPEWTLAGNAARDTRLGRAYLDWARYPLIETEKLDGTSPGFLVRFRDLRFVYPDSRRSAMGAYVLLSPTLKVEDASVGVRRDPQHKP